MNELPMAAWVADLGVAGSRRGPATPDRAIVSPRTPTIGVEGSLDRLAAFFDSEAEASTALQAWVRHPSLQHVPVHLLQPADGAWLHYRRRFHRLAGPDGVPPWYRDAWLLALLGALSGGVSASVGVWTGHFGGDNLLQIFAPNLAGGLTGAAIGAAASAMVASLPPHGQFDAVLRRHLRRGQWAVCAADIPWAAQAPMIAHLKALGVPWYALTTRPRWL